MSELIREIVIDDVAAASKYFSRMGGGGLNSIKRLGGMTNRSYRITTCDNTEYLFRIPGEGTHEMINRTDERKSTELACRLDIDSELIYFGDDGTKIMKFIHNPQYVNSKIMRKRQNLIQAAYIFRKLHTCGEDTGVKFEVFEMAELYEKIILKNCVKLYDDYYDVKKVVMLIKASVEAEGPAPKVPCHNDSLMGNWVLDAQGRLYLIDWEYSGMNEAMWDLACLSIEADYSELEDTELLAAYFGHNPDQAEQSNFTASKIYVDYLWTLWGLTRVPFEGDFMQEYADNRYSRLKKNIRAYDNINFYETI